VFLFFTLHEASLPHVSVTSSFPNKGKGRGWVILPGVLYSIAIVRIFCFTRHPYLNNLVEIRLYDHNYL